MSASVLEQHSTMASSLPPPPATAATAAASSQLTAMSARPQVGIERLPARRVATEPRESMNCKSCRKRKIKCNRMRPSCEACQVFNCPCIYDAVPKKRGPKTDVLEALLKRVDGLEQRLKEKKASEGDSADAAEDAEISPRDESRSLPITSEAVSGDTAAAKTATVPPSTEAQPPTSAVASDGRNSAANSAAQTTALVENYFRRCHAKPFHILDESTFRQRWQLNLVPSYLLNAICAFSSRYALHPDGHQASVKQSEEFALQARAEVDTDEPSIDALQTLLLLTLAFIACGRGRKAFMLHACAIGMTMALELHREMDAQVPAMPGEREMRRRVFWTCYLLDRFMACGSKRPSLIDDAAILLRLPCWSARPSSMAVEGEFFQGSSNLQYLQGGGFKKAQGSGSMLIDIARILGITNRYLAAGGVKGDSHFPWHSLSNLSKIRHELDVWASGTQDSFSSVEMLFGQPDSMVLVLSKLIYHLIHCLIYRPFLPIDLAELTGSGQHQSWQIEATNMCFMHANAIAELVELGKQMPHVEWSAFVGFCICTAGTVHVHGAHYKKSTMGNGETNVFSGSAEFLAREMQQLNELRQSWVYVQHHYRTLEVIANAHAELISHLAQDPTRYSAGAGFHQEDFFDRYANLATRFDLANMTLGNVAIEFGNDSSGNNNNNNNSSSSRRSSSARTPDVASDQPPPLKRKRTTPAVETMNAQAQDADTSTGTVMTQGIPSPAQQQPPVIQQQQLQQNQNQYSVPSYPPTHGLPSPGPLPTPASRESQQSIPAGTYSLPSHVPTQEPIKPDPSQLQPLPEEQQQQQQQNHHEQQQQMPAFHFPTIGDGDPSQPASGQVVVHGGDPQGNMIGYDPMFGTIPTNAFPSPAPWPMEDMGNGNNNTTTNNTDTNIHNNNNNNNNNNNVHHMTQSTSGSGMYQQSPNGQNNNNDESAGNTGTGEEKDPFLSLLEQLADNEYATGTGNELDFFLAGGPGSV